MSKKTIWILAGEASGDIYGAELAEALFAANPDLTIKGMGGIKMLEAGVDIITDSTELGVIGFVEVMKMYPTFHKVFNHMLKTAEAEKPDVIITVDYPGFNLRFAKKVHQFGIKTVHYVSPQVWAWGKKRLKTMPKFIDKLMVIFPFEVDVWKESGIDVEFIGHPLVQSLNSRKIKVDRDKNTVLLLPGSRFSELKRILKPMLKTAFELKKKRPELKFVIATPREKIRSYVMEQMTHMNLDFPINVTCDDTVEWLQRAGSGIAASGTVTVQAAILGLPLITVYRLNPITLAMFKMLIKLPFFTMVNIINGKETYEEFLQNQVKPSALIPAMERILPGGERREEVVEGMREMVRNLGGEKSVAETAANSILNMIDNKKES